MKTFDMLHLAGSRKYMMKNNAEIDALMTECSVEHMMLEESEAEWTSRSLPKWDRRLLDRHRARNHSPLVECYRRAPSPVSSVNNWRRVDGKPPGWYNSSDKWTKDVSSEEKTEADKNRVQPEAENGIPYEKAAAVQNTAVTRLTREYCDARWEISKAAAQGILLEAQLSTLRLGDYVTVDGSQDLDFADQICQLELKLENERTKLQSVEKLLEDVLRECETPVVVPELRKLAEMCGGDEYTMSEDK
ncbi:hypothetical protein B0H12DRAFT_649579 [Mycena haematopus]|nr:hypothetical protein B0H12DRAFT_649579 [Mycena haematopus]